MLIDKVEVKLSGGKGGDGKVSFVKIGRGPDGGNGGKGGDLYVTASSDLTLLNQFSQKTELFAENGKDGDRNKKSGRNGKDLELILPVGTSIISKETSEVLLELNKIGVTKLLCKGGRGGKGNWEFRSSRNTTPKIAEKGKPGVELNVILNLKLIADFGLIGLPNAGKSSLLNELTNAKARVANYQFTTLSPNLGVITAFKKTTGDKPADELNADMSSREDVIGTKVIADIPGLIEGASKGRGLGISFLKHIEKVKMLIHCISAESQNPELDYKTLRNELALFNPEILKKKELILLTKSDLNPNFKFKNGIPVSIYDPQSIESVKKLLF